jgi:hypothetical protein
LVVETGGSLGLAHAMGGHHDRGLASGFLRAVGGDM